MLIFSCFDILDGLVRRFIRDEAGVHFDKPSPAYDQKDFVPIEVKAGDFLVIHGDLIHQRSSCCREFQILVYNLELNSHD